MLSNYLCKEFIVLITNVMKVSKMSKVYTFINSLRKMFIPILKGHKLSFNINAVAEP